MKQEFIQKKEFIRLNELHDQGHWTYEELNELAILYKKFYVTVMKTELPNVELGKLLKYKLPKQPEIVNDSSESAKNVATGHI